MNKWTIDFGLTSIWDKELEEFTDQNVTLSYDDSKVFTTHIECISPDGTSRRTTDSISLTMYKEKGSSCFCICNEYFLFSSDQSKKLLSIEGEWKYQPWNPTPPKLGNRKPGDRAYDVGIVYIVDTEEGTGQKARLQIEADARCDDPYFLFVRTFGDSGLPTSQTNYQTKELVLDILGNPDPLYPCSLGGVVFLLSGEQVSYIQKVIEGYEASNKRFEEWSHG